MLSFPLDIAVFQINVFDIVEVGSRRDKEVTNISRGVLSLVENNDKTNKNVNSIREFEMKDPDHN